MAVRFCRDCANFEDRRDIEDTALCKKKQGPYVCCEEFKPKGKGVNEKILRYRFCSECVSFEDADGTQLCARNRLLRVGCEEFVDRFRKMYAIRQTRHIKAALSTHVMQNQSYSNSIPESLIEIGRKIRW